MLSQPFPEHVCGCLVEGIICLLPASHILCCVVSSLRPWWQPAALLGGSLLALSALVLLVLLGLSKAACKAGMLQPRGHYSDFCVNETLLWRPASGRQDGIAGQPLARPPPQTVSWGCAVTSLHGHWCLPHLHAQSAQETPPLVAGWACCAIWTADYALPASTSSDDGCMRGVILKALGSMPHEQASLACRQI